MSVYKVKVRNWDVDSRNRKMSVYKEKVRNWAVDSRNRKNVCSQGECKELGR
jgi:hypothetical protein